MGFFTHKEACILSHNITITCKFHSSSDSLLNSREKKWNWTLAKCVNVLNISIALFSIFSGSMISFSGWKRPYKDGSNFLIYEIEKLWHPCLSLLLMPEKTFFFLQWWPKSPDVSIHGELSKSGIVSFSPVKLLLTRHFENMNSQSLISHSWNPLYMQME